MDCIYFNMVSLYIIIIVIMMIIVSIIIIIIAYVLAGTQMFRCMIKSLYVRVHLDNPKTDHVDGRLAQDQCKRDRCKRVCQSFTLFSSGCTFKT